MLHDILSTCLGPNLFSTEIVEIAFTFKKKKKNSEKINTEQGKIIVSHKVIFVFQGKCSHKHYPVNYIFFLLFLVFWGGHVKVAHEKEW